MGLAYPADVPHRWQGHSPGIISGPRSDFRALGGILYKMLFGASGFDGSEPESWSADRLFEATRLALPLSPLQPCLHALLGVGSAEPVERAEDVLVELLALKECFPFSISDRPMTIVCLARGRWDGTNRMPAPSAYPEREQLAPQMPNVPSTHTP